MAALTRLLRQRVDSLRQSRSSQQIHGVIRAIAFVDFEALLQGLIVQ
jgi:hypothetical protein